MSRDVEIKRGERTVALTGAGFSKGIGMPLQDELLDSLVSEEAQLISKAIVGKDLDDHLGIEEFFSISDFQEFMEKGASAGLNSQSLMGIIPFELLGALHNSSSRLQRAFLSKIMPLILSVPTWVTLNWDTVLKTLFASAGIEFSYFYRKTGTSLLKLHGSMDWFKPNSRTKHYFEAQGFVPLFGNYKRLRQLTDLNSREMLPTELASILEQAPPAMIAPTHFKQFPDRFFRRIWRGAWSALSWANHVIIIGYSLPPSDVLIRLLLQLSVSRRITHPDRQGTPRVSIIDPDPDGTVEERYAEIFGTYRFVKRPVSSADFQVMDA
jgi:hypothetical protein